ncbi:hypothetical protein BCEN4_1470016 [Burkholderia cenocepacia]|nr:hypothetical protein BCEN4_1470016 [Burkholderia cenocepacia]
MGGQGSDSERSGADILGISFVDLKQLPVAAAPRDDNHRATAPAKAADAGTAH